MTTNQSGKLVMDIGSADREAHERIAEREDLAENARLTLRGPDASGVPLCRGVGRFSRCRGIRLGIFAASREVGARQLDGRRQNAF